MVEIYGSRHAPIIICHGNTKSQDGSEIGIYLHTRAIETS